MVFAQTNDKIINKKRGRYLQDQAARSISFLFSNYDKTVLLFAVEFFEKIVRSAFKYIAKRFQVFKLYRARFSVNEAVEILIAKSELDIKPIFSFSLFVKNIKYSEFHIGLPSSA